VVLILSFRTKILKPAQVGEASELLRQGQCVAFPTETVYGLGANALDEQAVAGIFAAKNRPADNPLIIHVAAISQLHQLVEPWDSQVQLLMDTYWPGPLTLVLAKTKIVPYIVTGGLESVGVRIPDHPLALELLRQADRPIAAPSANTSGRPSPTRAHHVLEDMAGRIPAVLDGGPTGVGLESTVLDCTSLPFRILRPGAVTVEDLAQLVPVEQDPGQLTQDEAPRSPGMKYRHYSPQARVELVVGGRSLETIASLAQAYLEQGLRVAVMAFSHRQQSFPGTIFLDMGSPGQLQEAAARIYDLLRQSDQAGCHVVLVEGVADQHLGRAIMNRLSKAAGTNVIFT